jgi:ribonuclease D
MSGPRPTPSQRARYSGRGEKRRRSHANAQSHPFSAAKVPEHPLIPAGEPQYIESPGALAELIDHVRQVGSCCYDTEFIGESFYHAHLCLVQIATPRTVAVVDALASGMDLTAIWQLLADPAVLKIVHAGMQDLAPVVRHLGRPAAHVFDTQIAAGFVGLPYPLSLTRLTHTLLNVRLGKKLTFTSWDHRPLSKAHLHYAADDVRFGPALHAELTARLASLGRSDWAAQQCAMLCDASAYQVDFAEVSQKIRGARSLSKPQAAALYEVVILRDELARLHDLPPRTMLRDDVVLELARRSPQSVEALDAIRGLPRPVKADFGQRLLDAVQRGLAQRRPPWPHEPEREESPPDQFRVDALWAAFQAYCRSLSVDPALVANRAEAAEAYYHWARTPRAADHPPGDWRSELLHGFIRRMLDGEETLTLRWRQGRLQHGENLGDGA